MCNLCILNDRYSIILFLYVLYIHFNDRKCSTKLFKSIKIYFVRYNKNLIWFHYNDIKAFYIILLQLLLH